MMNRNPFHYESSQTLHIYAKEELCTKFDIPEEKIEEIYKNNELRHLVKQVIDTDGSKLKIDELIKDMTDIHPSGIIGYFYRPKTEAIPEEKIKHYVRFICNLIAEKTSKEADTVYSDMRKTGIVGNIKSAYETMHCDNPDHVAEDLIRLLSLECEGY